MILFSLTLMFVFETVAVLVTSGQLDTKYRIL